MIIVRLCHLIGTTTTSLLLIIRDTIPVVLIWDGAAIKDIATITITTRSIGVIINQTIVTKVNTGITDETTIMAATSITVSITDGANAGTSGDAKLIHQKKGLRNHRRPFFF